MTDDHDLDALEAELAPFFGGPERDPSRSPLEERVLAGFEEIQLWVAEHGRHPRHGEGLDIFERLYAVRLERIRGEDSFRALLAPFDHQGLLAGAVGHTFETTKQNLDELAADLDGIGEISSELTTLKHVRPRAEIEAAEEIADRRPCSDFAKFEPLFNELRADLRSGARQALPFNKDIGNNTDARVRTGDFYILGGQLVYVAEMGEKYLTPEGAPQARLRVIYSNGTESNLLIRSLQNALYKDAAGRRVTKRDDGPLFAGQVNGDC